MNYFFYNYILGHARIKTSLVVPRFQNVKIGAKVVQKNIFYNFDDDEQCITLFPDAALFLKQNYPVLFKTVILEWSKFLEKINTFPRLIAKIETEETQRRSLTHYFNTYKHVEHCFYCNGILKNFETMILQFGNISTNDPPEFNNFLHFQNQPYGDYGRLAGALSLLSALSTVLTCLGVAFCIAICTVSWFHIYVSRSKYSSDLLNDYRIHLSSFSGKISC